MTPSTDLNCAANRVKSGLLLLSLALLVLVAMGILAMTALPLMQVASGAVSAGVPEVPGVAAKFGAATWARVHDAARLGTTTNGLPYTALGWAALGWISLLLAVRGPHSLGAPLLLAANASLAAAMTQAYGVTTPVWLGMGATALTIAVLLTGRQGFVRLHQPGSSALHRQGQGQGQVHTTYVSLVWLLWFCLTFLGLYWLVDISARGPQKLVFSGLRQLDALWLANFVVIPTMALNHARLMQWLLALRQAWATPRARWALLGALLALLVTMVWLGRYAQFGAQQGYPHISAEGVRALVGLSFAWVLSRYAEWGGSPKRRLQGGAVLISLLLCGVLTLGLIGDLGPILAIAIALIPGILMLLARSHGGLPAFLSTMLVTAGWLVILWLVRMALVDWLPQLDWAPDRLRLRVEALLYPFAAHLDYAGQMRWLLEAAGVDGFGLGAVPWCGAAAHLQIAPCTPFSGVSVQFASDYVYVATAALWGNSAAIALVAGTGIFLLAVGASGAHQRAPVSGSAQSVHLLHRWICAVFAAMAMGQLVVSVAGNAFLIPLSGVTQPLLGLGSASVLALAAWVGFALGGTQSPIASNKNAKASTPWIRSYASAMGIGVVALTIGLIASNATETLAVKDQVVSKRLERGLSIMACHGKGLQGGQTCTAFGVEKSPDANEAQSKRCLATIHNAQIQLNKWHAANALGSQSLQLSCEQASDVLLALRWAKRHSTTTVQNILETDPRAMALQIAVSNPYRLQGCIYLDGPPTSATQHDLKVQKICPGGYLDIQAAVPHTAVLNQKLAGYTSKVRAQREGGAAASEGTNFVFLPEVNPIGRLPVPPWARALRLDDVMEALSAYNPPRSTVLGKGKDLALAIQAQTQATAQAVANCYTQKGCALEGIFPRGANMLESARARMLGMLVIDAKSGLIEAAASAYTPCYQAQHQGIAKPGCLVLPEAPKARAWMLSSRALDATAMLASEIKVPLSLGLQRSQSPLTLSDQKFDQALSHSETEKFIDDALCADKRFAPGCISTRLRHAAEAAEMLGWRTHCPWDQPDCANINLLRNLRGHSYTVQAAIWMTDPKEAEQILLARFAPGAKKFTTEATQACHANNSLKRWRHCQGEGLVATVSELFGQGNATGSTSGVATGLLRLLNLAQSETVKTDLHPNLIPPPVNIVARARPVNSGDNQRAAQRMLNALSKTTQPGGTAHVACLKALAPSPNKPGSGSPAIPGLADLKGALIDCGQRGAGPWVIAAKTGTPLFPHDDRTHQERLQHCRKLMSAAALSPAGQHERTRCLVAPTKWFAAIVGKKEGNRVDWQKIIVVLAERNWDAGTGKVDTPLDRGGNVAAEIAIATAGALIR